MVLKHKTGGMVIRIPAGFNSFPHFHMAQEYPTDNFILNMFRQAPL